VLNIDCKLQLSLTASTTRVMSSLHRNQ